VGPQIKTGEKEETARGEKIGGEANRQDLRDSEDYDKDHIRKKRDST